MAETVLGFRIEVKGTEQETAQLTKLGGEIDQIKARLKLFNDLQRKGIPLTAKQAKQRTLLNTQLKASRTQYNALNKSVLQNNNVIKKSSGFIGRMTKSMAGAALRLGGMYLGFQALVSVVGGAVKIFVDFEKENSKLRAVLQANDVEMASLTEQSMALGSSTAFTATQVAELQTEYAKLGFPTNDILAMTEATLDGAAALGSGLSEQAALTGATLKQYGLEASKATEVNDIMATAAANSALDFAKLSTALPIVGATANAVGVSLKGSTALLGKLADRGLDASTSGTSLRNVFLELSKKGLTMSQAMAKINGSTDKALTSMQLFGKRGATTGLILADMEGKTTKLDDALVDVDGNAKAMAKTMLDNVAGDITIAKSAWEGFVLGIENGDGKIAKAIRSIVQGFTNMLTTFQQDDIADKLGLNRELFKNFKKLDEDIINASMNVGNYANAFTKNAKSLGDFKTKVDELTAQQKGLNRETEKGNATYLVYQDLIKKLLEKSKEFNREQIIAKKKEVNDRIIADAKEVEAENEKLGKLSKADAKAAKERKAFNDKLRADEIADELEAQEDFGEEETEILIANEIKKQLAKDKIKADQKVKDQEQFDIDVQEKVDKDAKEIEDAKIQAELLNEVEQQKRQFSIDAAAEAFSIISGFANGAAAGEIAAFDRRAREQLNSFVGTEAEKEAFAIELDKKREKLEKKAFERKKKLDIAQVFINLAQEISGINAAAAANPANAFTFGGAGISQAAVLTALAVGKAAAGVGMIASQKFADGGLVEGASHDQGGIQMYQKGGQHLGEMEGNEYIISAKRTKELGIDALNALNFGAGSMNGFFADGGSVPSSTTVSSSRGGGANGLDIESLGTLITEKMAEMVLSIPVTNNATETFDVARNVVNTESELKFG